MVALRTIVMFLFTLAICTSCAAPKHEVLGDAVGKTPRFGENEVFNRRETSDSKVWELRPVGGDFDPKGVIKALDPFTVILSRVYVPKPWKLDGGNIAVIVTVESGEGVSQEMVAYYQTGLTEGQLLNFRDLAIYANPAWDGLTSPYFRIQVWDVYKPEDDAINKTLGDAEGAVRSIGGLFPSPVIPIVGDLVRAAQYILDARRGNTPLLDYRLQFHKPGTGGGAHLGSATAVFQEGTWVLLGRPPKTDRRYFDRIAGMDRNRAIVRGSDGKDLEIPSVEIVISREDQKIASTVLRDSQAFATALASADTKNEPKTLVNALDNLQTSVQVYRVYRELLDSPSSATFKAAVLQLTATTQLSSANERLLVSAIRRFTDQDFTGKSQVSDWWDNAKLGHFDAKALKWISEVQGK